MTIDSKPTAPAVGNLSRLFACMFRQKSKSRRCPETPRLDGKRVLVTGGGAGVGEFVSSGLIKRGAQVTSISRGVSNGTKPINGIESIICDLAKPESIRQAVNGLAGRKFDVIVCNAGIMSAKYERTESGMEKTFAVNVFGHHLLYRLLMERGMLGDDARIVMTTGDIYVLAKDCTPDYKPYSGNGAYASSKLGNLWQMMELTKRYPSIHATAIHPGVIASGFGGGSKTGLVGWLKSKLLISEETGAQSSLIAASQNLSRGTYWHNVLGVVDLRPDDAAIDRTKSSILWDKLEKLSEPWL